jgi:signal transduction histidine kinase
MRVAALVLVLIFAFGAVACAGFLALWFREFRSRGVEWFGPIGALALTYSLVWFVLNLAIAVYELADSSGAGDRLTQLERIASSMSFVFAPLMMHLYYSDQSETLDGDPTWRLPIAAAYVASISLGVGTLTSAHLGANASRIVPQLFALGEFILFTVAVLFCALNLLRLRAETETAAQRDYRVWSFFLLSLLMLLVAPALGFSGITRVGQPLDAPQLTRALPLCFLFVAAYCQRRFAFFDILVKRGAYFCVTFVWLTIAVAFVLKLSASPVLASIRPLLTTLAVLPLLLTAPWVYRRLGEWIDRVYLGRPLAPMEAIEYFIDGALAATTAADLVAESERRVARIFCADAAIVGVLTGGAPEPEEVACEVPLEVDEGSRGGIRLGKRHDERPYFLEDTRLLSALAEIFCSLLRNVRLREQRGTLQRREERLKLEAMRSELKCLRAQVNPHFLFNALNTVAERIPEDPDAAEGVLGTLAEVFRHLLNRSDEEWISLAEEIQFLRSYLQVEKARFGGELDVSIHVAPETERLKIPTMAVQVLVENAMKHGVNAIPGRGLVAIRSTRLERVLSIEVIDNGPGFSSPVVFDRFAGGAGPSAPSAPQTAVGTGLLNLHRRLRGYFGDDARLTCARDETNGCTIVRLELPVSEAHSPSHERSVR